MTSDPDTVAPAASSLRQSTWTTPVVLAGLFPLFVWTSATLLRPDWVAPVPWWLLLIVTGIILQLFLLVYPLVTRKQPQPNRFRLPRLKRLLIEAAIAVPCIFGCLLLVLVVWLAITHLSPGTSLAPEVYNRIAQSAGTPFIYALLLASFAEEVFFRGFLFNAFRKRMPLLVAMLLQSLIFGFAHSLNWIHAIMPASLGLVLTLVYSWRKTIFAPIFLHAGFNGLAALSMFLSMHAHANAPVLGVTA